MNPIEIIKEPKYFPWVNTQLAEKILWDCLDWKSCLLSDNVELSLRAELDKVCFKTWFLENKGKSLFRIGGKIMYSGERNCMPLYIEECLKNFIQECEQP